MKHAVIYVPGLGDNKSLGQDIAIRLWRPLGLEAHYFPLEWNKAEGFETKLSRLLAMINSLSDEGRSVSLVGVSAGAGAVLNAFAKTDKVTSAVCICGKIQHPETIGQRYYEQNPDFEGSMAMLARSLSLLDEDKRARILSIHPWRDQTVPIADTVIEGAKELTLPGWGHVSGIFFGVTIGAIPIARFIRRHVPPR